MRDHPEGLRSVVLDSVYPPDVNLYAEGPANSMRALQRVADSCAADSECGEAYPDLLRVLYGEYARLNAEPARIRAFDLFSGRFVEDAVLDGHAFLNIVFRSLYISDVIPVLPQLIYGVADGDYSSASRLYSVLISQAEFQTPGVYLSTQCREEVPFATARELEEAAAEVPELADYFVQSQDSLAALCEVWDVESAGPEAEAPVTSSVPTLLLAGEFDPITPPSWAQRAARRLSRSYLVEFPGLSHGVSGDGLCPQRVISEFLESPGRAPSPDCLELMQGPDWEVER